MPRVENEFLSGIYHQMLQKQKPTVKDENEQADGEDRWSRLTNKIERYEDITEKLKLKLCTNCKRCEAPTECILKPFIEEMKINVWGGK